MKKLLLLCLLLTAATLATGCAPFAAVKERRPQFPVLTGIGDRATAWQERLQQLQRPREKNATASLATLNTWLMLARDASRDLEKNPEDLAAREAYNFAVARTIALVQEQALTPWQAPVKLPGEAEEFVLTWKKDRRATWNPALYDLAPADQFDVRGIYVTERSIKPGLGAPLVAIGREAQKNWREDFSLPRVFYGVTALVRFDGTQAEISLLDPLATEDVRLGRKTFPLAADFTVPLAVLLDSAQPHRMNLPRMLMPEKFAETAAIARLQPYDPDKTIVLVVHGLMDSPSTWTPMINQLRMDPAVRENFQFWFFSYPSGYPYPYSAALLRRELDAALRRFPSRKPIAVLGHSMGGSISRLLVTDPGERLWKDIFGRSPTETPLSAEHRQLFAELLLFRSRPEVGRVVFLAAPLQGADMARGVIGRLGSMLVRAPRQLGEAGREAAKLVAFGPDELRLNRMPNSIDTLAPHNRFVRYLAKIPLRSGTPYHVIVGDRGRGGHRDRTPPMMSDGVVPYWSSHLPQARSEKIVSSNHTVQQNPEAIDEVARILREHVRSSH